MRWKKLLTHSIVQLLGVGKSERRGLLAVEPIFNVGWPAPNDDEIKGQRYSGYRHILSGADNIFSRSRINQDMERRVSIIIV